MMKKIRHYVLCGLFAFSWIVLPACAALPGIVPSPPQADGAVHEQQFLEKTHQLQSLLEKDRFLEARQLLMQLNQMFAQLPFDRKTTVEGIQALSDTMIQLKHLLADVQLQPEKIRKTARQLTIAADALVHSGQSSKHVLWKEHARQMLSLVQTMREQHPDRQSFQQLQERYTDIRPALLVSQPPELVAQLDALFARMKQLYLQNAPAPQELSMVLTQWEDLFKQAYTGKDRPTFAEVMKTPLNQLILGLSAFVILSLAYAAWCYRAFQDT